jgi:flagellar motor switch/type III secretory pathway protein FliN
MTNEPVTVLVNGRAFAHGEIVSVDDRFGVRLVAILPDGAE